MLIFKVMASTFSWQDHCWVNSSRENTICIPCAIGRNLFWTSIGPTKTYLFDTFLPPLKVTLSRQKIQTAVETDKFTKVHQSAPKNDNVWLCLELRLFLFRKLSQICIGKTLLEPNTSWDFWRLSKIAWYSFAYLVLYL